ncbi:coat protein [Peanut clump virus]|uniref:Capsid protein n=1 Tax=Peanut clump virus (isolate 87/TGTA2) TaxID=652837 RepID=CAPSD_PCV87|nr:coat protein [Peanut clump virus]Q08308.1 RecName: Full=Capsid protein; AltName: Full=Coat protein; AltName: Full=P23 [Peanut clump virus 87/TGTA2]AAA17436.1 coat protein [Peanut clump virus]
MSNIAEVSRGGGHYGVDPWRQHIIKNRINADWWIRLDHWETLLADLRGVSFEVNSSRSQVADFINRVPKDLPAGVSVRFPGPRGNLGSTNYTEVYFVRIKSELKQKLLSLIAAADQGKNRDVEIGRPNAPVVSTGAGGNQAIVAQRGVNTVRDQQPLRDGSLHYRYLVQDIELAGAEQFDRALFEETFSLNWTVVAPPAGGGGGGAP